MLKQHLTFKHSSLAWKDITYFRHLVEQNKEQAKCLESSVRFSENVQEGS
jgi:hypothetical protein